MTRTADKMTAALAERQHGVVTVAQARCAGLTNHQIRLRAESGRWIALGRGAYRIAGLPLSWTQLAAAA